MSKRLCRTQNETTINGIIKCPTKAKYGFVNGIIFRKLFWVCFRFFFVLVAGYPHLRVISK